MNKPFKKNTTYEFWRRRIFGITWLAYAGFYLTRSSFSVAKIALGNDPDIMMSPEQMGLIDGLYLTAYAIGQFLWGALGDKKGTRVIVLSGLFTSVFAGFAMGVSSIVLSFGVFSFLQGLSQSTGWAPLAKNISNWFSQRERGVVMGWWSTNYTIGALVAAPFAGFMADYFLDWRYAFFMPALVLLIVAFLFIFLQKNRPEDVGLPSIEDYHGEPKTTLRMDEVGEDEPEEGSWKAILTVARNPMVILLGLVYFFLKPTRYAILFWGPLFVSETLGTGMTESALISVSFFLAGPVSVLVAGYASDKLFNSRRMPYSIISLFILAVVLFFFNDIAAMQNKLVISGLLFIIGFLLYGPDSLVSGTAALDFGTKKGASTASGIINGLGSIGAIVGGTIPGFFKESWGWDGVFEFLAVSVLIACIIMIPKWNALPKTKASDNDMNAI
ncbi:MAG: MFS transporter [Candidatus Marinimicrobia bacterium]|nr:MFS transporter [Candidatus Neomarinimicrobiota bacterium]